jgi:drug/metabolite transporter superfamily protein YnfA
MKFIKFLKENKKWILKWFFVIVLSVVAFLGLHKSATVERGYNAIGGEMFMFLIPFFVWIAPEIKKSIKEIKDVLSR